jgi:hypothetical protein
MERISSRMRKILTVSGDEMISVGPDILQPARFEFQELLKEAVYIEWFL